MYVDAPMVRLGSSKPQHNRLFKIVDRRDVPSEYEVSLLISCTFNLGEHLF